MAPGLDHAPLVAVVVSTGSALMLGIGIGFAGSYAFNLGCALVLAWWSEERLRADQL